LKKLEVFCSLFFRKKPRWRIQKNRVYVPLVEEDTNISCVDKKIQEEWSDLLSKYKTTIQITSGTGERGQSYIGSAYDDLLNFCKKHTEFSSKMPKKHICNDDGNFGFSSGLASLYH
jgi:hypothetical protein